MSDDFRNPQKRVNSFPLNHIGNMEGMGYTTNVVDFPPDHERIRILRNEYGGSVARASRVLDELNKVGSDFAESASDSRSPKAELPPIPNEKYANVRTGSSDDIISFLTTTWAEWLTPDPETDLSRLTRTMLKIHDETAYYALINYLNKHKILPKTLQIPTRSEVKTAREQKRASDPHAQHELRENRRKTKRLARSMGKSG